MIFISQSLGMASKYCRSLLKQTAELLTPPQHPSHISKATEFNSAVKNCDENKVNELLEEALKGYLHTDSLLYGMKTYCEKVGLNVENFPMGDSGAIKFIYAHRDEIDLRLKQEGL